MDPTGCFCTLLQPAANGNRAIKLRIGSAGKDDMQEDETMSSEASKEESHSASGGVGVDEEVSDSSNNNTMREEENGGKCEPCENRHSYKKNNRGGTFLGFPIAGKEPRGTRERFSPFLSNSQRTYQ